jgi:hypothetical protein
VLKCPNHLSGLKYLMETYPDARIVNTHRDPMKTVPSLCSLTAVMWSMTTDRLDFPTIAEFVLDLAENCEAAGREALQFVPRDQIIHVEYDELVRDPAAMAVSIYERFGYATDPSLKMRMNQWLAENPSDKHGKHTYSLEDFGLTPEIVRNRLAGPPVRSAAGE